MTNDSFLPYLQGRGQSTNAYGTGSKVYGGGRSAPNVGPVRNMSGYRERDAKAKGMREALLRRMKARQQGNFASSAAQTPQRNLFSGPGGF